MTRATGKTRAFTIVELLIVISIIALLMSILVPTLGMAKKLCQGIVCRAHMKNAHSALASYMAVWNGWFAGPNTSGLYLSQNNPPDPLDIGPTYPVQNMDWISPTMGRDLALPENGYERLAAILNSEFRCPSNSEKYDYVYTGSNVPIETWIQSHHLTADTLNYSSYSAALGFHTYEGAAAYEDPRAVEIPKNYRPKIEMIGNPAEKVYIMDGARYVNPGEGASFNCFGYQDDGGNFMLYGPSVSLGGDPFYYLAQEVVLPGHTNLREAPRRSDIFQRYAFRHEQCINAAFFDGHCEKIHWRDSLKTSYYFPSGTKIKKAIWTADPHDKDGQILP